jgi:hypothetical protein
MLGCADVGTFKKGKDAAACIGLTPIQHSSGGTAKIGNIGRHVKNSLLRSQLIAGAMSVVYRTSKKVPVTKKRYLVKCTNLASRQKICGSRFGKQNRENGLRDANAKYRIFSRAPRCLKEFKQ